MLVVEVHLLAVVLKAHGMRDAGGSQSQGLVGRVPVPGRRQGAARHLGLWHHERHHVDELALVAALSLVAMYPVGVRVRLAEAERVLRHFTLPFAVGPVVSHALHPVLDGRLLHDGDVLLVLHERVCQPLVRADSGRARDSSVAVASRERFQPRPLHLLAHALGQRAALLLLKQVLLLEGVQHRQQLSRLLLVQLPGVPVVEQAGQVLGLQLDGAGSALGLRHARNGVGVKNPALQRLKGQGGRGRIRGVGEGSRLGT
mmetsp:Transcript_734/g.1555  ORF Transcript_734/g.1555 Transcript_734/m.1555 type:complete len:258 (-) Transcript_734:202-975(-)